MKFVISTNSQYWVDWNSQQVVVRNSASYNLFRSRYETLYDLIRFYIDSIYLTDLKSLFSALGAVGGICGVDIRKWIALIM